MSFRDEIEDRLTPTLRRDLERQLPRLYAKARQRALLDTEPYEGDLAARLPTECPYTLSEILGEAAAEGVSETFFLSVRAISEEQRTTLSDPIRTEHRRQIMDGVFNGLIALNGGAAVAVFGFFQVVFDEPYNMASMVLWAISGLTAGFVFAVFFQILRY